MAAINLRLSALIYREDQWWIAHCIEMDVVAEGETPMKAFENLQTLTALQIETALEDGDLQSVFRQAPPEICAAFATGIAKRVRRRPPKHVARFEVRSLEPV
jgi:predicted RNase H-like HicB family nuclease